jgi:hypothetical protein
VYQYSDSGGSPASVTTSDAHCSRFLASRTSPERAQLGFHGAEHHGRPEAVLRVALPVQALSQVGHGGNVQARWRPQDARMRARSSGSDPTASSDAVMASGRAGKDRCRLHDCWPHCPLCSDCLLRLVSLGLEAARCCLPPGSEMSGSGSLHCRVALKLHWFCTESAL